MRLHAPFVIRARSRKRGTRSRCKHLSLSGKDIDAAVPNQGSARARALWQPGLNWAARGEGGLSEPRAGAA